MKNLIYTAVFVLVMSRLLHVQSAKAEELDFLDLWSKVRENSHSIKKSDHELRSSQASLSVARRHWLPSLTLSGNAFTTNDPGRNLFMNLSQRQIGATDFAPATLNEPGYHSFQQLSLGLNLPLFEGGSRVAEANIAKSLSELGSIGKDTALLNEYVETALAYSNLNSLEDAEKRTEILHDQVVQMIARYSIGNPSNPVGYSGMLGLRGLKNRLESVQLELQSKKSIILLTVNEKANLSSGWKTKDRELVVFLDKVFPLSAIRTDTVSAEQKMALAKMDVSEKMKDLERSKLFPKVGLFAQEGLTRGSRDTGTSFAGGIYLQWSLFDPHSFGRSTERNESYLAATSASLGSAQKSRIEKNSLLNLESTMKQNLVLLTESEKLLSEQVKVASRLFQSGSMNALQYAELLNRRIDLILALRQVEETWADTRAKLVLLSNDLGVIL